MYWGLLREFRYTFIFHLSVNDYSHAKSDTREQSVLANVRISTCNTKVWKAISVQSGILLVQCISVSLFVVYRDFTSLFPRFALQFMIRSSQICRSCFLIIIHWLSIFWIYFEFLRSHIWSVKHSKMTMRCPFL